jgi:hypothetical protein
VHEHQVIGSEIKFAEKALEQRAGNVHPVEGAGEVN